MLKFYPDPPGRRFGLLLLDLAVVIWGAVWVAAGMTVYRLVTALWAVSDAISSTGKTFNSWIGDFRHSVPRNIPFIGDYLSSATAALQKHTGDPLIQSGAQAHDSIQQAATALAVLTAAPPILIVGVLYLIWRWRQAREMGSALAFVRAAEQSGTLEQARALLAFRAVATLPFSRLMRASKDPVGDLSGGHHDRLAAEMLRSAGLESFRLFRRWPAQLDEATAAGPHRPALGEAEDLGEAQAERGAQRDG
ncbi:MAG: hypothetical protein M3Z97_15845 [Candidatus Dormibacteraeota bacterium]|nr:hypothetical protein [Candidatus Dormibacteraeota bacterium]